MPVLGIDYGLKHIGLALGYNGAVDPLKTLDFQPSHHLEKEAIKTILKTIEDERVDHVVIGVPYIDGKETSEAQNIRAFGNKLKAELSDAQIHYVNEAYTSKEASEISVQGDIAPGKRSDDHAIAAGAIIKRYWEPDPEELST